MNPEDLAYLLGMAAARGNGDDYTLMSRRGLQPTGQPFSSGQGFQPMGAMRQNQMTRSMGASSPPPSPAPSPTPKFDLRATSYGFLPRQETVPQLSGGATRSVMPTPQSPPAFPDHPMPPRPMREPMMEQGDGPQSFPDHPMPPPRPFAHAPAPRPVQRALQVARSVMPQAEARPERVQDINWGDPDNAADFFRADRELQRLRPMRAEGGSIMDPPPMGGDSMVMPPMGGDSMPMPPMGGDNMPPMGMPPMPTPEAGQPKAAAGGRDAAINKALEIIHQLVMRG
jgi:hypothetical protein